MIKKSFPLFVIFLTVFFCYHGILNSEFIGDDWYRLNELRAYFNDGFLNVISNAMPDRPLLTALLFLNYSYGKMDPFSFKLTSLTLHSILCFLLFRFFVHFQKNYLGNIHHRLALLITLIFATHTVHTQALISSVQVSVIISGIGIVGSLLFYSKYLLEKKRNYLLVSLLFFLIGLLSKPNIITLPLMLMILLKTTNNFSLKKIKTIVPFFILCLIPFAFNYFGKINIQEGSLDSFHYLLVQLRVIFYYFKLFLIPVNLHFYYDLNQNYDFYSWKTWLAFIGHFGILVSSYVYSKKIPYVGLAVAFVYLALVPESSIFPIDHIIFEHRTYVPYLFISFMMLIFLTHLQKSNHKRFVEIILTVFILIYLSLTLRRIQSVDTFEKWCIDDYQKRENSLNADLTLLQNLYLVAGNRGSISPAGQAIVSTLVTKKSKSVLHEAMIGMLSYNTDIKQKKIITLEKIANILLQDQVPMTFTQRSNFITFLEIHLFKMLNDKILYAQKIEPILQSQALVFLAFPRFHILHQKKYLQVLLVLKNYYENKLSHAQLTNDDFKHYCATLKQLILILPDKKTELLNKVGLLEKKYPQMSKLILDFKN